MQEGKLQHEENITQTADCATNRVQRSRKPPKEGVRHDAHSKQKKKVAEGAAKERVDSSAHTSTLLKECGVGNPDILALTQGHSPSGERWQQAEFLACNLRLTQAELFGGGLQFEWCDE